MISNWLILRGAVMKILSASWRTEYRERLLCWLLPKNDTVDLDTYWTAIVFIKQQGQLRSYCCRFYPIWVCDHSLMIMLLWWLTWTVFQIKMKSTFDDCHCHPFRVNEPSGQLINWQNYLNNSNDNNDSLFLFLCGTYLHFTFIAIPLQRDEVLYDNFTGGSWIDITDIATTWDLHVGLAILFSFSHRRIPNYLGIYFVFVLRDPPILTRIVLTPWDEFKGMPMLMIPVCEQIKIKRFFVPCGRTTLILLQRRSGNDI